jgi:hypothetical protein
MSRRLWALAALSGLACTAPEAAERVEVRVLGGWSSRSSHISDSEHGDIYKWGTVWRVGLGWAASRHVILGVEAGYGREPFDSQNEFYWWHRFDAVVIPEGHASTMMSVGVCARATPLRRDGAVVPYLVAGADVSHVSHELTTRHIESADRSYTFDHPLAGSNTTLWLALGAGVDIRLGRAASVFVEARLRSPSSAAPLRVPGTSSIENANQYSITAGIVLRP